jgi:phosphate transport system permease protein
MRAGVRAMERISTVLISIGGMGTIAAVALIFVFLLWVVAPLFGSSSASPQHASERPAHAAAPLAVGLDEYQLLSWVLRADAQVELRRLSDGQQLLERSLLPAGERPAAIGIAPAGGEFALARADGQLHIGRVGFAARFLPPEEHAPELTALAPGESHVLPDGLVQRTQSGELREQTLVISLGDPIATGASAPIVALDQVTTSQGMVIALLAQDGALELASVREKRNLLTGKITRELARHPVPFQASGARGLPERLLLSGMGDNLYAIWDDGWLQRYDLRDRAQAQLAEELDLVADPSARIGALAFLLGRTTLVVGDTAGRIGCWFRIKPDGTETRDGARLVEAHVLPPLSAAVRSLAISERSRLLVAGAEDGSAALYYVPTNERRCSFRPGAQGEAVRALALAPKEDGLLCVTDRGLSSWRLDLGYPEASMSALFRPIWYEGYEEPTYTWQSSSGTDNFEPKLSLLPLVYGTLKATIYSLLFGVPIALLAAIYTSEFLSPKLRAPIKSTVEVMASLPSVVLGFLAALVFAPVVQTWLAPVLALFVTVPLSVLLGAYVWQLLPQKLVLRLESGPRLLAILVSLPAGGALALLLGPWVQRAYFGGSIEGWLAGGGEAHGGAWAVLLLPLAALASFVSVNRVLSQPLRRVSATWSRAQCALTDLLKFALTALLALVGAAMAGNALSALGFDPRGSVVDTYVQRNALVVGFVMGFAIIPIIYTLAEDALSSVPGHLRLASLGAGATPWQTAIRIVVPTAMSGLFSAVMIGLGRAVGETMIVLMATGNTPVMDMNVFNGFRTLSANIAVEMPEAVRNSAHYRILFLAALALFAITFFVNTLAELVRQRFRKRSYQL